MLIFLPSPQCIPLLFFFNATSTTGIYTLSLHDALPIWRGHAPDRTQLHGGDQHRGRDLHECHLCSHAADRRSPGVQRWHSRSEEHTSELQSHSDLVCRLLLEKKKKRNKKHKTKIQHTTT